MIGKWPKNQQENYEKTRKTGKRIDFKTMAEIPRQEN